MQLKKYKDDCIIIKKIQKKTNKKINFLDGAFDLMKKIKQYGYLYYTKNDTDNYIVCILEFISGMFFINEKHINILRDTSLVLNDAECVEYIFTNKEFINSNMLLTSKSNRGQKCK